MEATNYFPVQKSGSITTRGPGAVAQHSLGHLCSKTKGPRPVEAPKGSPTNSFYCVFLVKLCLQVPSQEPHPIQFLRGPVYPLSQYFCQVNMAIIVIKRLSVDIRYLPIIFSVSKSEN